MHGKCVSGSTRLILTDGRIITAKELFKKSEKIGSKFKETPDEKIFDIYNKNIQIFSLNKETGKIEKKPIELAWKLQGGDLIKITLRNRFEISTTAEHKYIMLENNEFVEKEASDIKLGDRIICARKLDVETHMNLKKEIIYRLSTKNFYIKLNKKFGKELKEKILKEGLSKIHFELNPEIKLKSFYHGSWKNRYNIKDVIKLAELFKIDLEHLYDNIENITYRVGKHRGKSSNSVKLPNNFEDFYYLAGLFLGDGSHKKFVVGKKELGEKFVKICKSLGIKLTFRNYGYRTPEICTNQTLAEILNSLFAYPLNLKSRNIKISEFLSRSPINFIAKLIRGYFDCDGCVEKSRRAITISSASKRMIDDLQLLLLRFGCISIKEKDQTLTISGNSAIKFTQDIGFGIQEKLEKAVLLAKKTNYSYVCDTVKAGNQMMNVKRLIKNKLITGDLAYIEVKKIEHTQEDEVYDFTVAQNHNFVAEGMIIHNTTFSDNLLAGAGMMSEELAGKQLALDFHEDEQARGITIDSANVSMVHEFEKDEYLTNLIDTPGHIDFSGDVTRAMRAVDGAIVLCCAVEGIMPQTETVLRQALKERVKPVLFINKVDRLIKEVKLTPEAMQQKFVDIISSVNKFIEQIAPDEYKQKWKVSIQEGSVAFGSAFHNWAVSFPYMKKSGITFKEIIEAYQKDDYKPLAKKAPLHKVILNMVIRHHPNPIEAQKYRVPKIWHGDLESEEGKSLVNCNPKGPVAFVVTKIVVDKHAGEVSAGRLFSGTLKQGQEVVMNMAKRNVRLQQVSIYKGAQRIQVDEIPAGNICGIVGLKDSFAGETVSSIPLEPFESLKHLFEPVVTKSIEAKSPADLPKLVEVLKTVNKEDPTLFVEINEETGENLISGMGELHLEIIENRIKTEKGLDVITSPPIVVYRETVTKKSGEVEGKSPNKHNKFYIIVEPLEDSVYKAIKAGELPEMRIKKKDTATYQKISELGIPMKEARQIRNIYKGNLFIDATRGEVHIGEVIEMVLDAFEQVMDGGPLAREPCMKLKVSLTDTKLHEDAIHRGPAQVYPAMREATRGAMRQAGTYIYEPLQVLQIEAPAQYMGELSKLVANKRGQLLSMDQHGEQLTVKAKMPVAEMFGLASDLRSATAGRGNYFIVDQVFEKLPEALQEKVIKQIRQRKGLGENE